jgi:PEP-CTERM motif-containing protein
MKNIFTTRVLIGLVTLLLAGPAWAQQVSSTVAEDNGATTNNFDGNQDVYGTPNHPAVITSGNGYDFTLATLPASIGQITITLTVFDGDSGIGDFDFDHLHLYLGGTATFAPNPPTPIGDGQRNIVTYTGGVDTGILLNGFEGSGFTDTLTFTANVDPNTTGSAILAEIASHGGFLPAYIVTDNTASDTLATPNEMIVGNPDIFDATTTLMLAVPEPSTYFGASLALLGLLGAKIRRSRKAP